MNIASLKKEEAVLIMIDMQEKLLPAIKDSDKIEEKTINLVKGCRVLGCNILVTQQYTKGLGATIENIDKALTEELFDGAVAAAEYEPFEKKAFSALQQEGFDALLEATGKKSIILCGVETHICTQATCIDLLRKGYNVYIAADCVGSRAKKDNEYSLRRMEAAGAIVTTCESILYEMLGGAGASEFKMMSKIIK